MSSTQSKFPSASREDWHTLVSAALKGGDPHSLDRLDEDGLAIKALYDIASHEAASPHDCAITRLPVNPAKHIAHGWDICQPVMANGSAKATNRLILDELQDGVGTIWLQGLQAPDLASHLATMMQDVVLAAAGIHLDAGNDAMAQIAAFADFAKKADTNLAGLHFHANVDPFAPAADVDLMANALAYFMSADSGDVPPDMFRAQGWQWHNQGMTAVQELAYILASLTEILRQGMARDIDPARLAKHMSASLALPASLFDGIAKCRALRRVWGGVVSALGLDPDAHRLFIHGAVSIRMFSTIDSEVNMLRTTTALLGGAIGGADQLSSHAHNCLTGDDILGRRLARMQQHLLIDESGLSRSLDPAGGAGFIEDRTDQLGLAAWTAFQQIEADGGALAGHQTGQFTVIARHAAAQRHARLAAGDLTLVGVNLQPDGRAFDVVLPYWQMIRRPAAAVEMVRHAAVQNPPRILILQQQADLVLKLAKLRGLFAIGGMQPVHVRLNGRNADAIDLTRPDLVILLDGDFNSLDVAVRSALSGLLDAGKAMTCDTLLGGSAPLETLANLVGLSLEPFRKGDA